MNRSTIKPAKYSCEKNREQEHRSNMCHFSKKIKNNTSKKETTKNPQKYLIMNKDIIGPILLGQINIRSNVGFLFQRYSISSD